MFIRNKMTNPGLSAKIHFPVSWNIYILWERRKPAHKCKALAFCKPVRLNILGYKYFYMHFWILLNHRRLSYKVHKYNEIAFFNPIYTRIPIQDRAQVPDTMILSRKEFVTAAQAVFKSNYFHVDIFVAMKDKNCI